MKKAVLSTAKTILSRLFSALRLGLGVLLLVPIFAFFITINYTVDCQGYFLGDTYLREIANKLFEGENVADFNQLNKREREVLSVIVANMDDETIPETIALGSSRILQLNQEMVGTSFYNSATSGGDFSDILSAFALYDFSGKLPENVIIGIDPWIFNPAPDANSNPDTALAAQFVSEKLNFPAEYTKKDPAQRWKYLFDLTYFQGNIEYLLDGAGAKTDAQLVLVPEYALMQQESEIKRPDGSLVYAKEYREQSQNDIDFLALTVANNGMFRLEDYLEPQPERLKVFEAWVSYMKRNGINVSFIFSPYHPIMYDRAATEPERYGGMIETENAVRAIAKRQGIPVYGSYNPTALGFTSADFYDGLHPRGAVLKEIFPGIGNAQHSSDPEIHKDKV